MPRRGQCIVKINNVHGFSVGDDVEFRYSPYEYVGKIISITNRNTAKVKWDCCDEPCVEELSCLQKIDWSELGNRKKESIPECLRCYDVDDTGTCISKTDSDFGPKTNEITTFTDVVYFSDLLIDS
jgi:hypothetical protein